MAIGLVRTVICNAVPTKFILSRINLHFLQGAFTVTRGPSPSPTVYDLPDSLSRTPSPRYHMAEVGRLTGVKFPLFKDTHIHHGATLRCSC